MFAVPGVVFVFFPKNFSLMMIYFEYIAICEHMYFTIIDKRAPFE